MEEWNDVYASIKVNVTGDFNEKSINLINAIKSSYGTEGGVIAINTDGELYDANDPTQTIREYRYSGASVNNYVTYNNETWRIIGIFSEELEDGTTEEYVKIVNEEKTVALVFEFISGRNLSEIKPSDISFDNKLKIIKSVGSVLECMHAYYFIHRDLKPANIIINDNYDTFFFDFGIAKITR